MASVQFPYPRKTSDPQPYISARASSYTNFRRRQSLKRIGLYLGGAVLTIWLLSKIFGGESSSSHSLPAGTPEVVVVTTIDPKLSESYKQNIKDNRRDYAERHGYATFFPNTTDYDLTSSPSSWSLVPALRHAMTLYPNTPWIFYLSSTALIMNPRLSLDHQVLNPSTLSSLMITDKPVVPPDSVIKTFSHLKPERVNFILSQDKEGLAGGALLIRAGDWAKFFLDAWYDPLYRSYNFQKAEGHALEHIVQWHGTILARLALIPQRVFNSYTYSSDKSGNSDSKSISSLKEGGCHREGTNTTSGQASIKKVISLRTSTVANVMAPVIAKKRCGHSSLVGENSKTARGGVSVAHPSGYRTIIASGTCRGKYLSIKPKKKASTGEPSVSEPMTDIKTITRNWLVLYHRNAEGMIRLARCEKV